VLTHYLDSEYPPLRLTTLDPNFHRYLTEKVDGASFLLVSVNTEAELLAAAAAGCLDFVFGDAAAVTCVQLEETVRR
jgi:hypothetical protein